MSLSSDIRVVAQKVLADGNPHELEEVKKAVKEQGIDLPKGSSLVRAALHFMKKRGDILTLAPGVYQCIQRHEPVSETVERPFDLAEMELLLCRLDRTIADLKGFDWIGCSDVELERARKMAAVLKQMGSHIKRIGV